MSITAPSGPVQTVFMPVDTALTQFITALQQAGSRLTDFNIGAETRNIGEAFATVVSNNTQTADSLQLDSHLSTATGDALDALATNWQVQRNPAVQAAGQITITRQDTSGALTIAAGWGQLAAPPSAPGNTGVAILTTQDANFADTVATATVSAQAVLGGQAGNLTSGVFLTPLAPVNGVSSQDGFEVTTPFTGGVDQESDDAFRARIPIAVQGRVLGRAVSFLAAALGVPGVLSANVLTAGATRGDGTIVPAGSVETYYQGSVGLLAQVQSAVANAATAGQNPSAFASISLSAPRGQLRVVAVVTVYCLPGTDPTALGVAVAQGLQAYVNGTGVGNPVYLSQAIEATLAVSGVVSVGMPLAQLSLFGGSGAADITVAGDSYANLALSDVMVTVNTI